ncbi:MAG: hypothetical protein HZA93_08775 [Verrucomicrobia bacterium]|nr:hypothetical protein [Verrucomicrobiota bacterium]
MKTFTVFAYCLPSGAHYVEAVSGLDATDAVIRLRAKLALELRELEVVAVVPGELAFERVDLLRVALAPYDASSP